MAVIVYRCRVCNREIELQEQPRGLEVINRCIITNDCRGSLYKVDRKENFAVGEYPDRVTGLTNYIQRKVLYTHTQPIDDQTWLITHNLGTNPSVQVFADRSEQIGDQVIDTSVEIEPQRIEIVDQNTIRVFFDRPESGQAQLLARTTAPTRLVSQPVPDQSEDYLQVSTNGVLTVAIKIDGLTGGSPLVKDVTLKYVRNDQAQSLRTASTIDVTYNALFPALSISPWNDVDIVIIEGVRYAVRTINYGNPVSDNGVLNGTSVFFNQQNAEDIKVLLSTPPFENVDKDRRRLFRPSFNQGPEQVIDSFIFLNGNFFAHRNVVEDIFPPIYVIS